MNKFMKNFVRSLIAASLLVATYANALPTLFFDGDVNYNATTGELSVTTVLTATEDIALLPELSGSSLTFSALFMGAESYPVITGGDFGSATLSVIDGNAVNLLSAELSDLTMLGRNGRTSGRFKGITTATNGSLVSMFGAGKLSALGFNLIPGFSANMFEDDFTSRIDGRIVGEAITVTAVPEPGTLALLGIGLAMLGVSKRKSKQL